MFPRVHKARIFEQVIIFVFPCLSHCQAKRQLSQYGIYSEADRSSSTTNATNSHYSSLVSSLTPTYGVIGDRGSSADSGVRLSSDRDSGAGILTAGNLSDSANEGWFIVPHIIIYSRKSTTFELLREKTSKKNICRSRSTTTFL